jgi:protein translocase SecG subunit
MSAVEATPTREKPRSGEPLLRLQGIVKHFPITRGIIFQKKVGAVHAVDGVDLEIYPARRSGSSARPGCGKSTLARVAMRLHDATDGTILFDGRDITRMKGEDLRAVRRDMQMIFQDPTLAEPRKTVGTIVARRCAAQDRPKNQVKTEVQKLMELVGLNPSTTTGTPTSSRAGQRQRIGVARAPLAPAQADRLRRAGLGARRVDPGADPEPADDLQDEFNLTYLFIAHDLSVVKHISDRVAVMYLGKIVEAADGSELYTQPKHPYTGRCSRRFRSPTPTWPRRRSGSSWRGTFPRRSARRRGAGSTRGATRCDRWIPRNRSGAARTSRNSCRTARAHRRLSLALGRLYHRCARRDRPWEFRMINAVAVVFLVLSSIFLIVTILMHSGKGSGLSDMFGGGNNLSGGTSLERTLDRITVVTAIVWGLAVFWLSWKWY